MYKIVWSLDIKMLFFSPSTCKFDWQDGKLWVDQITQAKLKNF